MANQVKGLFEARRPVIKQYLDKKKEVWEGFNTYPTEYVRRNKNKKTDALSKLASMIAHLTKEILVEVLVEVLAERSITRKEVAYIIVEKGENGYHLSMSTSLVGSYPKIIRRLGKLELRLRSTTDRSKPIPKVLPITIATMHSGSNLPFNNNPQNFNNQSILKGLVSNFMASKDARLSNFEAYFKQQQTEMTNKIDTFLNAINDRMTGALPSDTVKNPKLNVNSTSLVLSAREGESRDIKQDNPDNQTCEGTMEVDEFEEESKESKEVEEELEEDEEEEEEVDLEYFDTFPTMEELGYHEWLLKNPRPPWVNAKVGSHSHGWYGTNAISKFSPDTELVLYPLQDKLTSGDKSLDLSAFKLSRLFFSLLSSGSSSCWRSYGDQ
ncbi:hypothetical protein Tco_1019998 [Tanacetum coccineum]|uniref:Uncharacterized protein n=1 Tax=Tanacetum coccineum TaxID=301880 RepID=A0ABQ5FYS6_9ASTR